MTSEKTQDSNKKQTNPTSSKQIDHTDLPKEIGGRKQGLEPTRYGDWEKNGRCIDF